MPEDCHAQFLWFGNAGRSCHHRVIPEPFFSFLAIATPSHLVMFIIQARGLCEGQYIPW